MANLIDQLEAAREVSTPLLAVTSPDQPAIAQLIAERLNGETPIIHWDRARGFIAHNNPTSKKEIGRLCGQLGTKPEDLSNLARDPATAMKLAQNLAPPTILIAHSLDRFINLTDSGELIQAILNLRDPYKGDGRTLIMLSPDFRWPSELQHDVIVLDDPLPTDEGYSQIITELYEGSEDLSVPPADLVARTVRSVRGLSPFEAEQILAMSMAMADDPESDEVLGPAWDLKVGAVSKVKGLTMTLDGPALAELKGLDRIINRMERLWQGPTPPELVMRVDEIDKAMAGLGSKGGPGDNTGIAQDLNQQFLVNMEDNGWKGALLVGLRGAGKTVLTQSIGAAHGVPTIAMDPGKMKGSLVGQSETAFRDAFRMVKSIGGSNVLVLATCNKLDVLPPELLRRFKLGIWFFDILDDDERAALWPIYLSKYGLDVNQPRPNDSGWTGAEIRNCCEIAHAMSEPIIEIGETMIVPVTQSNKESIADMRREADGTFLSVKVPGRYTTSTVATTPTPKTRNLKVRRSKKGN